MQGAKKRWYSQSVVLAKKNVGQEKCFFNNPDKIVRVSSIEQKKYKTIILGDHRQETKGKENKTRPVGLGHQHGLPLNSNSLAGRVGTSTQPEKYHTQRQHERPSATTPPPTRPLISKYRKPLKQRQHRNGARGQATPHRKGRCHAGPNAAPLLQPSRPTDDVNTTKSEGTHTRVRGDPTHHSVRFSLMRGDLQTRRTARAPDSSQGSPSK
jgi:hypothetical protein